MPPSKWNLSIASFKRLIPYRKHLHSAIAYLYDKDIEVRTPRLRFFGRKRVRDIEEGCKLLIQVINRYRKYCQISDKTLLTKTDERPVDIIWGLYAPERGTVPRLLEKLVKKRIISKKELEKIEPVIRAYEILSLIEKMEERKHLHIRDRDVKEYLLKLSEYEKQGFLKAGEVEKYSKKLGLR